jgi:OmcA/MtrC family decaheme c-type cytochrome
MQISVSVRRAGRFAFGFLAVAGSLLLLGAPKKIAFTPHDKAYYADSNTVAFVRPGLSITVVSAKVASDGTISVDYKLSDPKGLPLDRDGIQTPGPVSVSFCAAYVPKGQTQYFSYTTRTQTSPITKDTAIQAATDSGGTTQTVAMGEYVYTFKTKAIAKEGGAFDPTATHRLGIYGNRNLTEFDLGTNYDSETFDFVPAGGKPAPREVIKTASCNKCHSDLAFHGGSRRGLDLCIMCHTDQTTDPDTGNTVDMKVFAHKIHMGSQLPSVKAGKPYQVIGFQQSVSDWSTVNFPSDPRRCESCHESGTGAAQANAWYTNPNRAACGSCHDNVNFATGANHVNLPQVDDKQCSQCHIPQGELELDASIKGAHVFPQESAANPGLVFKILSVDNGAAGKAPAVTFTVQDFKGNGVSMTEMAKSPNRIALVMAGPTADYGYTSFGSDVTTPGYVSENPVPTAKCGADGTCLYTFTHAIPAKATGSFSIGIEGRRSFTILPGTTQATTANYGAKNDVFYFSVDGSKVQTRRTVVAIEKCNQCHTRLSLHGENRNQIQQCVMCHNPSENDSSVRPVAQVAADKTQPPQSVYFALMIHKIHTGENLAEFGASYTIVGFGGSHNDFSDVRYPVMGPTGSTGDTTKCDMCHVNNSEAVFPIGKNPVLDTQGRLSPVPTTTAACTACHLNQSTLAHAVAQTDPKFGESCDTCHAAGTAFDVLKEHAGK